MKAFSVEMLRTNWHRARDKSFFLLGIDVSPGPRISVAVRRHRRVAPLFYFVLFCRKAQLDCLVGFFPGLIMCEKSDRPVVAIRTLRTVHVSLLAFSGMHLVLSVGSAGRPNAPFS
jgi:hypothetical protein